MVCVVDGRCLFQPFEHGVLLGLSQLGTISFWLICCKALGLEGRHTVIEHRGGMGEFRKGLNGQDPVLLGFAFSGLGFLAALADLNLGLF